MSKRSTKWDHPSGVGPCRVNENTNGTLCGWCSGGRPPEFTCQWFTPGCPRCLEKLLVNPSLIEAKSPRELLRERNSPCGKGRQARIAVALVGAEQRIADYHTRTGNPIVRLIHEHA